MRKLSGVRRSLACGACLLDTLEISAHPNTISITIASSNNAPYAPSFHATSDIARAHDIPRYFGLSARRSSVRAFIVHVCTCVQGRRTDRVFERQVIRIEKTRDFETVRVHTNDPRMF
jgi:hypothetical protein